MSRKNIKVDADTKARTQRYKRDNETWDEYIQRLTDYAAAFEIDEELGMAMIDRQTRDE